jgi:hypothetical protein
VCSCSSATSRAGRRHTTPSGSTRGCARILPSPSSRRSPTHPPGPWCGCAAATVSRPSDPMTARHP